MSDSKKGYLAAISVSLIIGMSFVFTKMTLNYASVFEILGHRFFISFLALLPIVYINKKTFKFSKKQFFGMLPLVILFPILFFIFQILGLNLSSSSEAGIIQSITPILTLVIAVVFLKKNVSIVQKFFTILSVFGVIFIFVASGNSLDNNHIFGLVLVGISSLCFAIYMTLVSLKNDVSPLQITFIGTVVGMIFLNILGLQRHGFNLNIYLKPFLNINYIIPILYLGVLSSMGTSLLTTFSLKKIDPSKVSVISNLSIIVTILGGVVFLNESISWQQIVGGLIILVGVVGTNLSRK